MDAYIVVFETFAGLDLPLQSALLMDVLSQLICIAIARASACTVT